MTTTQPAMQLVQGVYISQDRVRGCRTITHNGELVGQANVESVSVSVILVRFGNTRIDMSAQQETDT